MRLLTILGLLPLPFAAAGPPQLRLFHRLYHPLAAQAPFTERGTVTITDNNGPSFQPAASFQDDFNSFAEVLHTVNASHLLLYQVALERHADNVESQWDISSVKACHIPFATSEMIYLHSLDIHNPIPHALDYFITPISHDGGCLRSSRNGVTQPPLLHSFVNTSVILRGASSPPVPLLIAPPPLSLDGEPITPVPEKTFLQKYWMYMLALVLFTLFTGSGEEEQPKKQD